MIRYKKAKMKDFLHSKTDRNSYEEKVPRFNFLPVYFENLKRKLSALKVYSSAFMLCQLRLVHPALISVQIKFFVSALPIPVFSVFSVSSERVKGSKTIGANLHRKSKSFLFFELYNFIMEALIFFSNFFLLSGFCYIIVFSRVVCLRPTKEIVIMFDLS